MAKKEVMKIPVLGALLKAFGVIGVDRESADISAIKQGLRCLNDDQQMMIFPEGTRVKEGESVPPKRGALMLAARTNTPVLPVYLSRRTHPLCPVTCVIGEPYMPAFSDKRATDEELKLRTEELMEKIRELGEKA